MVDIERLKELVADNRIWMQEYMLKVVPEEDQLVTYNDIRWYDEIPSGWEPYFRFRAAGVDLAITKNLRSDLTAVVSAEVYRNGKDYHIFIQRNSINKRFNFRETIEFLHKFKEAFPSTHLFVESVGYQMSLIEQLREEGIDAHEAKIGNLSKQERLAIVVHWIRKGMIHFPTDGATDLVNQIVNFGAELHDDLLDAFTLLIMQIMVYANDDAIPAETDDYSGPMIVQGDFMDWVIRTHNSSKRLNLRTLENDPYGFEASNSFFD